MQSIDKKYAVVISCTIILLAAIYFTFVHTNKPNVTKNVGFLETDKNEALEIETKHTDFKYMNRSDEDISAKTTILSYNLEEIDKISKFALKNLNKSESVCLNIIEIHAVKKEIDTKDITSYSLDMYLYDNVKNSGYMARTIVYEINGKLSMKDAFLITPVPMASSTNDSFTFEKIVDQEQMTAQAQVDGIESLSELQDNLHEFVPNF